MDEKLQEWLDLVAKITNFNLVEGRDHLRWNLHNDGIFTVRSMYLHEMNQHAPFRHIDLETKNPSQDKDFLLVSPKRSYPNKR